MVADQYRLADPVLRPQTARGIGQHHHLRPGGAGRAHGVHDVLKAESLVGVDAAEQHQHPMRTHGHREDFAAVAVGAGRTESGQLGHGDLSSRRSERGGRLGPARPQHYGDVVAQHSGSLADRSGRPLRVWPHSPPA